MRRIILASKSPRRRELLAQAGYEFDVIPSDKEETMEGGTVENIVMNLAKVKANDVYHRFKEQNPFVIGADTIVVYDGEIFGKPKDEADAVRMLNILSGNTHEVMTGVCMVSSDKSIAFCETTKVTFYELAEQEIEDYIRTGEPFDKAGAYGIQGVFAKYVKEIIGDYYNVVGLPIARVYQEIKKSGLEL
ncbi:MAG: septum formation inhibitor Maf [Lachnospiraceae bacterium]|nr:septum formation inhibitor Maf [Lachnospiraceae bacterium]